MMLKFSGVRTACLVVCLGLNGLSSAVAQMQTGTAMDHSHMPIEVPESMPAPLLSLRLVKDTMSGFNLTLKTQHFVLMPPPEAAPMSALMTVSVDQPSGKLTGHAHLYINGEKIQRIYASELHLPAEFFKNGVNTISVTLNNHGHMYWSSKGKQIVSTLYIDPSADEFVTFRFDSFPVKP